MLIANSFWKGLEPMLHFTYMIIDLVYLPDEELLQTRFMLKSNMEKEMDGVKLKINYKESVKIK